MVQPPWPAAAKKTKWPGSHGGLVASYCVSHYVHTALSHCTWGKKLNRHSRLFWPTRCTDESSQRWSLWIFLFPAEEEEIKWVTDHLQTSDYQQDSLITRLIKCVALWEMRYWAASMASITAKTLFCTEEKRDFKEFMFKSEARVCVQTEVMVYLQADLRQFSPGTSYSGSKRSLKGKSRDRCQRWKCQGTEPAVILTPPKHKQGRDGNWKNNKMLSAQACRRILVQNEISTV